MYTWCSCLLHFPSYGWPLIFCLFLRMVVAVVKLAVVVVCVLVLLFFMSWMVQRTTVPSLCWLPMETLLGKAWPLPWRPPLLFVAMAVHPILQLGRVFFHHPLIPMCVPVDVRLGWGKRPAVAGSVTCSLMASSLIDRGRQD